MRAVYDRLVEGHDLKLVSLAAFVAILGAHTAIELAWRIRIMTGYRRRLWLLGAALSTGATIWITHFVAVLSYRPALPIDDDLALTAGWFLVAVLASWFGLMLALARDTAGCKAAGGVVIGLAIAAMRVAGLSALRAGDAPLRDIVSLIAAAAIGCAFAATAFPLALSIHRDRSRRLSTGLLILSICTLPNAGTADLAKRFASRAAHASSAVSPGALDTLVAIGCMLVLLFATATLGLARTSVRERTRERVNPRDLADIAVEGLLVCRGDVIVSANASFLQMTGIDGGAVIGTSMRERFAHTTPERRDLRDGPVELSLKAAGGETIPVEVMRRSIRYAGTPHEVVAIRDLRERRRLEEEVRCLAHRDPLTDVANRLALGLQIDRALQDQDRHGGVFCLLALDLDRFRSVNDAHGHRIGDLLLKQVARRLKATVRATDTIARRSSDAFAILATAPMTPEDAALMARRVVEVIRRPFLLDGKVLTIGSSIGVVMAPQDGSDQASLLQNADLALGQAREQGRNTVRFFEPAMDRRMRERGSLELDLRRALAEDQIRVFYQPLFDVSQQRVRGFEALVRWESPERGLVMPNDFIPLAEETGLIVEIGERVLRLATGQAAEWGDGITMAVNLSAVQFGSTNLVETVEAALRTSGLAASRLELEITESVLLKEDETTMSTLHALRGLGVRISMDDFGTGYSSLRYLRSFPFDKIKIDRSFVQEMLASKESAAIIRAVLGLGQRLGIVTTAEGVETVEQRAYLEQEGCDVLQGYLIGRPVSPEEAYRFVRFPTEASA